MCGVVGLQRVHTQRHPWSRNPCTCPAKVALPFGGSPAGGDRVCPRDDATKIAKLEDEAEEPAKRLAGDVDLFGEGGSGTQ